MAIFSDGGICHTGAIGVAGNHVTNDLALGLRTPFAVAEKVKIHAGSALSSEVDPKETLEIETYDCEAGELISRRLVAEIIESRMQEVLSLIRSELARAGFEGQLPAGVVLVGGTAELRDIELLGKEVLGASVRVKRPTGAVGLTDTIMRPAYATSIGLLLWAAYQTEEAGATAAGFHEWRGVSRIKGWFREFLT
jgi:cell division protein FtsA